MQGTYGEAGRQGFPGVVVRVFAPKRQAFKIHLKTIKYTTSMPSRSVFREEL